jgi:PAS domain S-box-containing protein
MAVAGRQAKNHSMFIPPPPRQPQQTWLWLAPYAAIGIFALAMLVVTALLQWRERDTALSALEGDMHWAERTIETRLRAHQDFLSELGREQEFRQLTYEAFQVRASRYVRENPEIAAILWIGTEGKVEWVAPHESTATFVGDQLTGIQLTALQEALRTRRPLFSPDYPGADRRRFNDLILPVQRGSSDLGAFAAMQSLEGLLRVTLPASFTTRYNLSVVDAEDREVFSNTSVRPTDRRISGSISLDLPGNRLGLNIVAYRGGGAWLPFVPAALIVFLTLLASATLLQLRRHARRRAETEEQLRAAYAFRQAMSNSLVTGLRAIDLEGRITFVNAAFCRMTGFAESELLGVAPPYPYWPPEEFDQLQRNIEQALAGQAPAAGFEMRIMRKNGERFDVRLYFSPLIDAGGRQIGWIASMNDITEPRRVRVELERAHERFATVIDGLDTAVHVADAGSGEILFANRAFQNIFGFDAAGRDSALVTAACRPPPEALDRDPAHLEPADLPCEIFDGEIQHALSGHWYHLHERAIRWVDGRTVRVQIAADITDRKHIDEVNLQQQKRLEQTSRLITMGEMASSLAHELNQPLSAIANYCAGCVKRMQRRQLPLRGSAVGDAEGQRSGRARRQDHPPHARHGEEERPQPGARHTGRTDRRGARFRRHRGATDGRPDRRRPAGKPAAHRRRPHHDRTGAAQSGQEWHRGDARHAFRAPPPEISARQLDARWLEVDIADHGHGLPEEDVERIFAPFYTTKLEGMGIGLPSAARSSSSTRAACGSSGAPKAARYSVSPYRSRRKKTLMSDPLQTIHVVDDDEAMRDSMAWLLEGEGYAVACYDSADSFLAAHGEHMHGCLILDVRMPQMSGLELHEKLDALGSQLPIIFVTGHGDVPMAVSALQRGACDFIEKPFTNEDLLSRIRRALQLDSQISARRQRDSVIEHRLRLLTQREREVMQLVVAGKAQQAGRRRTEHQHEDRRGAPRPGHGKDGRAHPRRTGQGGDVGELGAGSAVRAARVGPSFPAKRPGGSRITDPFSSSAAWLPPALSVFRTCPCHRR